MAGVTPEAFHEDSERFDRRDPLAGFLGTDEDFGFSELEIEGLVSRVNDRIDRLEVPRRRFQPWYRHLAAAAVIALLFGTVMIGYLGRGYNENAGQVGAFSGMAALVDDEAGLAAYLGGGADLPFEESDIDMLLHDYTTGGGMFSGESLLDDLTDAELKYLESNFDLGDML